MNASTLIRSALLAVATVPDPDLIREHTQRHHGIAGALMLQQEIQEHRGASDEPGREQQIAVVTGERRIDERATLALQRAPGDRVAHARRQQPAQQRGSVSS